MEILTIAGLSGSGKTSVLQVLSEERFVILESLEAESIKDVISVIAREQKDAKIALVLRFETAEDFSRKCEVIEELEKEYRVRKMFLRANAEVLVNRYRELRKTHPLMLKDNTLLLEECIASEIEATTHYKLDSDVVIDTTNTTIKDLRQTILNFLDKKHRFTLNIMSFGFKYGGVKEADFVFDCRFLPNPYYIPELRPKTGLDSEVYDYVFSFDEANLYYDNVLSLIKIALDGFKRERRVQCTIAFACTGGKHRSVSFAERLAKDLAEDNDIAIRHLEGQRGNWK